MSTNNNELSICNYSVLRALRAASPRTRSRIYKIVNEIPVDNRRSHWLKLVSEMSQSAVDMEPALHQQIQSSTYQRMGIVDEVYPSSLYALDKAPLILYAMNSRNKIPSEDDCVAIVGSRKADQEGIAIARWFGKSLASSGVTVISGLAYGADAAAHWGALASGYDSPTIAVLGGGLDQIYPRAHERLANHIVSAGGALLSEYDPQVTPRKHHFLERNRIVAGLSRAVIVVQAGKRSGALSTARYALDLGKDVYVVPGSIQNPLYAGANALISDGAIPVTNQKQLFEDLDVRGGATSFQTVSRNPQDPEKDVTNHILSYLCTYGPSTVSALVESSLAKKEAIESALLELEVHQRVRKLYFGRYAIC